MCTFCEKIYPEKDYKDILFGRGKYSSMEEEIERFITVDEDGQYDLNVNPGDPYESGFFPNVKFCPYCGRDLAKLYAEKKPFGPCDLCRFNPPSSADGKPCTMCPAEKGSE